MHNTIINETDEELLITTSMTHFMYGTQALKAFGFSVDEWQCSLITREDNLKKMTLLYKKVA